MKQSVLSLLLSLIVISCAKQGIISGGPKDESGPELVSSFPPDKATNFTSKKIELTFNEHISTTNPDKLIELSPKPKGVLSYKVRKNRLYIELDGEWEQNTTYNIINNNSIADITEKNKSTFGQLTFSSGHYIDSLSLVIPIKNPFNYQLDNLKALLFLPQNDTNTRKPYYISRKYTDNRFILSNLRQGLYSVLVINDKNDNNSYDSRNEHLAFLNHQIDLISDTVLDSLQVFFNDERDLEIVNVKHTLMGTVISTNKPILTAKTSDEDIHLFTNTSKPNEITVLSPYQIDSTLTIKLVDSFRYMLDTVIILAPKQNIPFDQNLKYSFNLFKDRIEGMIDSPLPLKLKENTIRPTCNTYDKVEIQTLPLSNKIRINIPLANPEDSCEVLISGNGISTFPFENPLADTIIKIFLSDEKQYGSLSFHLKTTVPHFIVQLVSSSGEAILTKSNTYQIKQDYLPPGKYRIRFIEDKNKDGLYTTGNYKLDIQPEPVKIFPEEILIKSNWSIEGLDLTF